MRVQEEQRQGQVARIAVYVSPADYQAKFQESLRQYRRQVQLPGFRPGTVPMSLVKKRYGLPVLYDQVTKQGFDALIDHLQERGYDLLGQPLLVDTDLGRLEPLDEVEYSLDFEVGLRPEVQIELDQLGTVEKFEVQVADADVEEAIELQRYRHGTRIPATAVEAVGEYEITGTFFQLETDGSLTPDGIRISLDFLTLHYKSFQQRLAGKRVGEALHTRFADYFPRPETGANVLRVSLEGYAMLENLPMKFVLEKVEAVLPHELNGDFFRKVMNIPRDAEVSPDEFRERFREAIKRAYAERADVFFRQNLTRSLLDQTRVDLPVEFIERLMVNQFDDVNTVEELRQKHPSYLLDMKLYLAHEKLQRVYPELQATDDDLKQETEREVRRYFQLPDEGDALEALQAAQVNEQDMGADDVADSLSVSPQADAPREGPDGQDASAAPQPHHLVQTLVERMMNDRDYLKRQATDLENRKLFSFLQQRIEVKPRTVTKAEFDRLYAQG